MTFMDLVRKRRSVRAYSPMPVPRESIDRCLEAARLAPSACNSQPWSFVIVDDGETVRRLSARAFAGIYSMNSFVQSAPVLIAVITERSTYTARLGGYFRGIQYSLIDIGIACEHLILQAAEEGLGTCWLGWFNEKEVKHFLGLPRGTKIDILISMGYPEEKGVKEKARRPLELIRKYRGPCGRD
jgi:nitroreductase